MYFAVLSCPASATEVTGQRKMGVCFNPYPLKSPNPSARGSNLTCTDQKQPLDQMTKKEHQTSLHSVRSGSYPLCSLFGRAWVQLPWVPEVFLACGRNFWVSPKADTASAVGPETALEKSLAPRVG